MRRVLLTAGLMLAITTFAGDSPRRTYQFDGLTFGELSKDEIVYGCGCSFHHPPSAKARANPLIQWELGELASMHLDGLLEKLEPAKSCFENSGLGKVESCALTGPGLTADISARTSWVCPVDSESCEVTEYTGTMTVSKGGKRATIPVWGACGC